MPKPKLEPKPKPKFKFTKKPKSKQVDQNANSTPSTPLSIHMASNNTSNEEDYGNQNYAVCKTPMASPASSKEPEQNDDDTNSRITHMQRGFVQKIFTLIFLAFGCTAIIRFT